MLRITEEKIFIKYLFFLGITVESLFAAELNHANDIFCAPPMSPIEITNLNKNRLKIDCKNKKDWFEIAIFINMRNTDPRFKKLEVIDLTPSCIQEEDLKNFLSVLKRSCNRSKKSPLLRLIIDPTKHPQFFNDDRIIEENSKINLLFEKQE